MNFTHIYNIVLKATACLMMVLGLSGCHDMDDPFFMNNGSYR